MIRFTLFVLAIALYCNANVLKMPTVKFEAFRPSGIRVSLPETPGLTEFFLWANINEALEGKDLGTIMLSTYEPTNGVWEIEDLDVVLNVGDTLYYTFFVNIDGVVHRYERQEFKLEEIVERPKTTTTTTTVRPTPTKVITTTRTTTPTAPPLTTTTTAKPISDICFGDDIIQIKVGKEVTTVIQRDRNGKIVSQLIDTDCSKSLVVDADEGHVRFESL